MNALTLFLILVSLLTFVAGQILLKRGIDGAEEGRPAMTGRARGWFFAGGIGNMTVSFFIQLGLLQKLDLSFLFPFQGLSVIVVTLGASIFLKERLTLPLVAGALLITVGIMLVSSS